MNKSEKVKELWDLIENSESGADMELLSDNDFESGSKQNQRGEKNYQISRGVLNRIESVNRGVLLEMNEMLLLKGYSKSTIRTYCIEFAQLLYIIKKRPVRNLDQLDIKRYLVYCHQKLNLSENQIHSRLNAIKFYFEQVLKRDKFFIDIPRPKKPLKLPKALSREEVDRLFSVVSNIKHRIMLKLCYGMGLRVSEVVNLKISNIDSNRMMVLIESAKGKKDRYVPLPSSVLPEMRVYYKRYRPEIYLFEGQNGGMYSVRSAQAIFKNAMKRARINKNIGIHGLRHSYATHLVEYGVDMYMIQKLLGHNDIKTTEIYAKVSRGRIIEIRSPLDR